MLLNSDLFQIGQAEKKCDTFVSEIKYIPLYNINIKPNEFQANEFLESTLKVTVHLQIQN